MGVDSCRGALLGGFQGSVLHHSVRKLQASGFGLQVVVKPEVSQVTTLRWPAKRRRRTYTSQIEMA
jgi:hypothetical protein